MNQQTVIDYGTMAVITTLKVSAPGLIAIMLTGLVVSILQAATQISEQTLSFIPKVLALSLVLFFTGPWILNVMMIFTKEIFSNLGNLTR